MCGIVGYVGKKEVVPVILEGLRRLEYRGYDSAGIAVGCEGEEKLQIRRAPGKLRNIEQVVRDHPLHGTYGIGHTRWATHGRPTEENAHPHRDCTGRIVVVHNGIVENYLELKRELISQGHVFVTETDTEIIAHLIEQVQKEAQFQKESAGAPGLQSNGLDSETWVSAIPLEAAVRLAVKRLTGAFALGVLSSQEPDKIVAARSGPPAVIGLGEGEYFVASDVPGILHHTREIVFLNDGEMAILTLGGVTFTDFEGNATHPTVRHITWDPIQAEKGGYKHFMLKEIWEQPRAIRDTTLGRVSLDSGQVFLAEMGLKPEDLAQATSINIAACGTSWHAATAGKYMIERLARLPVEVDYASEYRYRNPIADPNALGLLITQSGETADTLAAQREMIALGSKTVAICNVVGAMITRDANG
ncbi:MAG TPA: glutamine--fructose-6-phosphate transaminase (isomerizing), partial [Acidobacteriaceae bacterium]|nr:glutamine--fructose-6-phosphate transaminase (isomerizing) [Acidobacteriaceae bacterium]